MALGAGRYLELNLQVLLHAVAQGAKPFQFL